MQQPLDAIEIATTHELVSYFAYLMDSGRFDAVRALVTDDICYENSHGKITGWNAVREGMGALAYYKSTHHQIGNHFGKWENDDFHGVTYCIASHVYDGEGGARVYIMGIRYSEHIVRVGGQLKLKHRTVEVPWQQDTPAATQAPEPFRAVVARLAVPGTHKS